MPVREISGSSKSTFTDDFIDEWNKMAGYVNQFLKMRGGEGVSVSWIAGVPCVTLTAVPRGGDGGPEIIQFTAGEDFDSSTPTFSATATAVLSSNTAVEAGDGVTVYNEILASGATDQVGTAWKAADGNWHCFWQCAPT